MLRPLIFCLLPAVLPAATIFLPEGAEWERTVELVYPAGVAAGTAPVGVYVSGPVDRADTSVTASLRTAAGDFAAASASLSPADPLLPALEQSWTITALSSGCCVAGQQVFTLSLFNNFGPAISFDETLWVAGLVFEDGPVRYTVDAPFSAGTVTLPQDGGTPTPEPSTAALLACALSAGWVLGGRRRKRL